LKPFDVSGAFVNPPTGELRGLAIRGVSVTLLAQVLSFGIQIITIVVLARLLLPADFGVVAMVSTFSLLLASFGQMGYSEAILQCDRIDRQLASNLFWINSGSAVALSIGMAAAAPLLAHFYHDERVTRVTLAMAVTVFMTSTSVLHIALLRRAMRFSALSVNDIISRIVSVSVSIYLAWAGWGYWALVAAAIVQPLSLTVGAWSLCSWLPGLPRRSLGTGALVRFALHVYGQFTIDYFTRNSDNLLVGWRFGSGPLGLYKKAYDIFALSSNQLASVFPVGVSTLSRLRNDQAKYERYLLAGLSILAFAGAGLGAYLTLNGSDLVRVILGEKWGESGKILTFFGPGIGIMLIYCTHGIIHLSLGTPHRWFRWGIVQFLVTGTLFCMGLSWGPQGVAAAWTLSYWLLFIPAFSYAGRPIDLSVRRMLAVIWRYVLASLVAAIASYAVVRAVPSLYGMVGAEGAICRILLSSSSFGILYLGAVAGLHGSFQPLINIARLFRDALPAKQPVT
jgi:polysaccharide transporter, PST family